LRTTLRSVIAGSQRDLILASPFWDLEVATDLSMLLARRLEAGVRIRIIARDPQPGSPSDRAISLISRIEAAKARCDIRILDKVSARDRFGRETFHFKMVGADRSVAYIGSANFDTAGLASRWELGVLLRADSAREVFDLVNALADGAQSREGS
jgi:phosphatidylserine/phosphatidylglycerophosphate/cardiolipin synthase-like enzyme